MFATALEVIVLVVTIIDLPEAIHVHLSHKRYGLLRVELVLAGPQVRVLELVSVQVDQVAVVGPSQAEVVSLVVDEVPKFFWEKFLVLVVVVCQRLLLLLRLRVV